MLVKESFDGTFSLPHAGHFTVPGMSRIIMALDRCLLMGDLPLLNDVAVGGDLSFDQSPCKYMVDQIVFVFIYLARKYHFRDVNAFLARIMV